VKTKTSWRWDLVALASGVALILHPSATNAAPGEAAADRQAADLTRFSFGTPTSVTRRGFTKVTVEDAFRPEKGFGFQSTQGLLAYDRGGSEIVRPKDEYTARTYGAYRTTSDLTCAFIEGTTNNAFVMALPDDEYVVWLVASDAEWDRHSSRCGQRAEETRRANSAVQVRLPGALPGPRNRWAFADRVQGPHGWLVNGLVIGKAGSEMDNTVAKLERDIFFLTEPELANWREVKSESANPPLEWTDTEQEKGMWCSRSITTEPVVPTFVPARATIGKPLTAFATPGEFEPASFCVSARRDLGQVTLELSDFVADTAKRTIARQNVKVGIVRCWPQRAVDRGGRGEYQIVPEMIEAPSGRVTRVLPARSSSGG